MKSLEFTSFIAFSTELQTGQRETVMFTMNVQIDLAKFRLEEIGL